jgi:hypothetical protein
VNPSEAVVEKVRALQARFPRASVVLRGPLPECAPFLDALRALKPRPEMRVVTPSLAHDIWTSGVGDVDVYDAAYAQANVDELAPHGIAIVIDLDATPEPAVTMRQYFRP